MSRGEVVALTVLVSAAVVLVAAFLFTLDAVARDAPRRPAANPTTYSPLPPWTPRPTPPPPLGPWGDQSGVELDSP